MPTTLPEEDFAYAGGPKEPRPQGTPTSAVYQFRAVADANYLMESLNLVAAAVRELQGGTIPVPAPTITSFTPTSGPVGTLVAVEGTGFGATPAVKANNIVATVQSSTDTHLIFSVPAGGTGAFTITAGGQTATSTGSFTVVALVPHPVDVDGHSVNTTYNSTGTDIATHLSAVLGTTNYTGFVSIAYPAYTMAQILGRLRNGGPRYPSGADFVGSTLPDRTGQPFGIVTLLGALNTLDQISGLRFAGDTAGADAMLVQLKANLASYISEALAKNWYTILVQEAAAQSTSSNYTGGRNAVWFQEQVNWNDFVLANGFGMGAKAVVRTANDGRFATPTATYNAIYYADGIHLSDTGRHDLVTDGIAPAVMQVAAGQVNVVINMVPYATPAAPTGGVVDDVNNTFGWTPSPSYPAAARYEYTRNGGLTFGPCTANPQPIGNVALAAGQVGVRVMQEGTHNASTTLFSTQAFTTSGAPQTLVLQHNDSRLLYPSGYIEGGSFSGTAGDIVFPEPWDYNTITVEFFRDGTAADVDVTPTNDGSGPVILHYSCAIAAGPALDSAIGTTAGGTHSGVRLKQVVASGIYQYLRTITLSTV